MESLTKEFIIHDLDGYERLMKSLDEAEKRPRKHYEKPKALEEGEKLIKEILSR